MKLKSGHRGAEFFSNPTHRPVGPLHIVPFDSAEGDHIRGPVWEDVGRFRRLAFYLLGNLGVGTILDLFLRGRDIR